MKKFISTLLSAALILTQSFICGKAADDDAKLPTLTVDMSGEDHDILHGSAGFLYGISNAGVPDVNTLTPLKPKVLATKGALGTEHPYGDALDVADEFFEAGGEQVQMYTSNYYGVFGVTASTQDYGGVLKNKIAPAVAAWKDDMREKYPDIDKRIVYIPINEGTPAKDGFNYSWKVYYDSIKASDPSATIAGPNDAVYRGRGGMTDFLRFCRDNGCMPDVVTWHELQVSCLDTMDDHIADYRSVCESLGVEEKQVVINEYADYADCGVPGRLVNWIARFEDNEVFACLPFWHQANNLNDLAANANQGNGAWQVYKWYGDMSGKALNVAAKNTTFDGFYGVASIDENKKSASVLCGGVDGGAVVRLKNLDDAAVFAGNDRVKIKVEASYFTGYHGAAYEPETVLEGVFPVADGGVEIELDDTLFSTAYYITVTEADGERVGEPSVGRFRAEYEAEDAALYGDLIIDDQNAPLETPRYFCSGGYRVGGIDSEGEGLEYFIEAPVDGLYRLSFIYGNGVGSTRNNASTHKPKNISQSLIIDNEEQELYLPNTLFYSMEGMADKYVNLTRGRHSVKIMYSGEEGAFHDALIVTYEGAYGEERPVYDKFFEAESADFNAFGARLAFTEAEIPGYGGSGYVSGLDTSSVSDGGGIRWIVDVSESGLYDLKFRYSSEANGEIRVYLDNTNLTFTNLLTSVPIFASDGWGEGYTTVFLRQGINIIDVDSTCAIALDRMRVTRSEADFSQSFDAVNARGDFEASDGYVREIPANGGYLEFDVEAPESGLYKMQVFQSNDDLCGTHNYNIKIIDRYASFDINGENAGRWFFPNTFSDDTFLEKTIPIKLEEGKNTLRVYNDDSWEVYWGGSKSTPGTNRLENATPNFLRFVITPAVVKTEPTDVGFRPMLSCTKNGYLYGDKNFVKAGESLTLFMLPKGEVKKLTVNGEDVTYKVKDAGDGLYTADIVIEGETSVYAEFSFPIGGDFEASEHKIRYVTYNGENYKIVGENLYKNGNFADYSGNDMEQWFVGTNTSGHPTDPASYAIPRMNKDGGYENLVPLTESGLLTVGGQEIDKATTFYYGKDSSRTYLVEHIGEPWRSNAYNGAHSLLSFVPIEANKKYYYHFSAYTSSGSVSVRCGPVDMDEGEGFYAPVPYSENDGIKFCGTGYLDCPNGGVQNVGGKWRDYSGVIEAGEGADFFMFNAYWLQMAEYLCIRGFELTELSDEPMKNVVEIKNPSQITVSQGADFVLPRSVDIVLEGGEETDAPVTWLNSDIVDTSVPAVYSVTGRVELPDDLYFSGSSYIHLRVVVADSTVITEKNVLGRKVSCNIETECGAEGTLYIAGFKGGEMIGVYGKKINLAPGETEKAEAEFEIEPASVKFFLWENESMKPLV